RLRRDQQGPVRRRVQLLVVHCVLLGWALTLWSATQAAPVHKPIRSRPMSQLPRPRRLRGSDGDVPGWVMVTLMSALLVAGIYAVAGPALINMFTNAINKVGGLE
ncbi:hypothetical protein, partial [Galactobacter sp.]|uniref:hypothetical protein n=1 Tax=Galactobacter sp. TaxID=2676125 RepID=UPI0025BCC73C